MTVAEMIAELQKYPPDVTVWWMDWYGQHIDDRYAGTHPNEAGEPVIDGCGHSNGP